MQLVITLSGPTIALPQIWSKSTPILTAAGFEPEFEIVQAIFDDLRGLYDVFEAESLAAESSLEEVTETMALWPGFAVEYSQSALTIVLWGTKHQGHSNLHLEFRDLAPSALQDPSIRRLCGELLQGLSAAHGDLPGIARVTDAVYDVAPSALTEALMQGRDSQGNQLLLASAGPGVSPAAGLVPAGEGSSLYFSSEL